MGLPKDICLKQYGAVQGLVTSQHLHSMAAVLILFLRVFPFFSVVYLTGKIHYILRLLSISLYMLRLRI